jgi:O-antigen/teichoic acid export membrane protein
LKFGERVGRSVLWNLLGRAAEFGAAYAVSVLAARAFGPVGFGTYSIALSIVTLCYFATSLGLNEVLNVHVPRLAGSPGGIAWLLRSLLRIRAALALALSCALFLAAPWIARAWGNSALEPVLRVAALYAFFSQVSLLLEYFFIGRLDLPRVVRVRVAVQLLNLIAAGAALRFHLAPDQLLLALACSGALGVAWLLWGARATLREPGEPFDLAAVRRFGLTVWMANLLNFFLGRQSDILLIGLFRPGTDEAGCYAAASLLVTILASGLLMGVEGVTMAAFAEVEQRVDRAGLGRLWTLHLKMDVLLSVPLLIFGARYAREIIEVLYGAGFARAGPLLLAYAGFWVVARIGGGGTNLSVLYALNDARTPLLVLGVSGVANLLLNLVLVPRLGALGAVIGTGLALVASSFASARVVAGRTGGRVPVAFALKMLLACGAALLAVQLVPLPQGLPGLAMAGGVGFVICLAGLRLLRPFDDDDRRLLAKLSPAAGRLATWL